MLFEIKSWYTGEVLFSLECGSLRLCIEAAIRSSANLTRADLTRADLTRANLTLANLTGANLTGANLTGAYLTRANLTCAYLTHANLTDADLTLANLTGAYLTCANLTCAYLTRANLTDADLTRANLTDAYLTGADLTGADLTGADLTCADLTDANLTQVRDDLWAVLSAAPSEVDGLRAAIADGRIDGSHYEGSCACLVGTIAKVRGCHYEALPILRPNSNRLSERFFLGIKVGDTPDESPLAKTALEWVDTWLANMRQAFGSGTVSREAAPVAGAE